MNNEATSSKTDSAAAPGEHRMFALRAHHCHFAELRVAAHDLTDTGARAPRTNSTVSNIDTMNVYIQLSKILDKANSIQNPFMSRFC